MEITHTVIISTGNGIRSSEVAHTVLRILGMSENSIRKTKAWNHATLPTQYHIPPTSDLCWILPGQGLPSWVQVTALDESSAMDILLDNDHTEGSAREFLGSGSGGVFVVTVVHDSYARDISSMFQSLTRNLRSRLTWIGSDFRLAC